jgi:pimeloyl-ACP methyl ester carboxylesterase
MTPFAVSWDPARVSRIKQQIRDYRWPAPPEDDDWRWGMQQSTLKTLTSRLADGFNWDTAAENLNRFPQFIAQIDGFDIHFVHLIGEAGGKRPLLLTHGWPGSHFEFWGAAEKLAFPSRFGGNAGDAFDLVIPSLPGYGFSGRPARPKGQRWAAGLLGKLMTETLGYNSFRAQGGDWGSIVTSWLAFDRPDVVRAIHLNMIGVRPTPATPQSPEEVAWLQRMQAGMQAEGSYFLQQATKPQTLAFALHDNPVGTAAWILEKFHGWSDLREGDLLKTYDVDKLLTNLAIYLTTDAIQTSVWFYRGLFEEGGQALPEGKRVEVPTGFANFPGEKLYAPPPRSWCDRAYNVTHWSEMPRGGHFAAMEEPDNFVADVQAWARGIDN